MDAQENRWLKIKQSGHFKRQKKRNYLKIKNTLVAGTGPNYLMGTANKENNSSDLNIYLEENSELVLPECNTDWQDDGCSSEIETKALRLEFEVDEESCTEKESYTNSEFCKDLRKWSNRYNIRQNALKVLINIINRKIPNILPKDPRTLLQTPPIVTLQEVGQGQYWHHGLKLSLDKIFATLEQCKTISLKVNVDGLPTFKSSRDEFWPILFKIREMPEIPPMVIGIYCGKSKPCDLHSFLGPFVEEMKDIMANGYFVNDQKISVIVECFICDSPARAFIKGVANFNSQNGCQKCTIKGEYSYLSRTNYYPRKVFPKRTDAGFRSKSYGSHHKLDSPLLQLPIDMIQDFPVADSLHLIDLGIMKRCLMGWRDGNFGLYKTKWSAKETESISKFLLQCKMPTEMHRAVRGLDCLAHWKGLEYRTFLHYISIVILKDHLPIDAYQHFLLFFCAITICSSNHYNKFLNLAHTLLSEFVEFYGDIYGADYITSNVHNLSHLVDDVKRFGILPKISAYPFETKLFQIKNLLRTGHKPLVQAAKRLQELNQVENNINSDFTSQPCLKKEIYKIDYCCYSNILNNLKDTKFYSTIKLKEFLLGPELENKWFLSRNEVISFKFAILQHSSIFLMGCPLKHTDNYFETPIKSSFLNIYTSDGQENFPKIFELQEVSCKLVPISEPDNKCFIFIPLLHTISFD